MWDEICVKEKSKRRIYLIILENSVARHCFSLTGAVKLSEVVVFQGFSVTEVCTQVRVPLLREPIRCHIRKGGPHTVTLRRPAPTALSNSQSWSQMRSGILLTVSGSIKTRLSSFNFFQQWWWWFSHQVLPNSVRCTQRRSHQHFFFF